MKVALLLSGKRRVFEVTPWSWTVGQLMSYVPPPKRQHKSWTSHHAQRKPATVGIG